MNNWRFVNCIAISLIFQCILLPLLNILDCLLLQIQTRSSLSSDSCRYGFFCIIYGFRLCRENTTMEQTNVLFCCIVHFICAESVTQWIWKYKAILCVMSTFTYSCSVISRSFLWKCHSARAAQRSDTYSIPHSLLLYSVHVKWILICVQNVIKMKIHLIIYFVHYCAVCWFMWIYSDEPCLFTDSWKQTLRLQYIFWKYSIFSGNSA